jgi:hypothetical protein
MNLKTTYILFAILIAAMAGLALTQLFGLGKRGTKSDFIFPDLHAKKTAVEEKEINSIRIEHAGGSKAGTFAFVRNAGNWEMVEPRKLRVDQFAVDKLVGDVVRATQDKVETTSDLKEYELDKPRLTVTFTRGEQSWTLEVGREDAGSDPHVYVVTSSRRKEPMAVRKSALPSVFKSLNEFRARGLIAANDSEIDNLELRATEKKEPLVLAKKEDGRWIFQQPAGFGEADYEGDSTPRLSTDKSTKITGVRDLLRDVTDLRVENVNDFVTDEPGAQELKDKYGLDKSNSATLRIVVTSSKKTAEGDKTANTETLLIGKKVPEDKPEKKEEKKDEKKDVKKEEKKPDANKPEFYYARLENENSVVKVPAKSVDALVAAAGDADALRDRDLAHFDRNKIDAIQVENSEGSIKLFKVDGAWKLWRDKSGSNAERSIVDGLLDTLNAKKEGRRRIDSFPTTKPDAAGMDKNARLAVVSLWEEGLKKQDKADAQPELKEPQSPTVRLTIGKQLKDRALVYVLRETAGAKEGTLLLAKDKEGIKEGLADRVTPGPLAYLDRKVPTYAIGEGTTIKQLDLTRPGETYQLKNEKSGDAKSGEPDVWKFAAPKELDKRPADTYAVHDIIFGLNRLTPLRVAAEKPDDKQLEGFGLKPPQVQATLTLATKDNKEEKFTYSFGKETPDKTGVFLKSDRNDLVYVVPTTVMTPLQAELQDKTLFSFDVDKVRGLKLAGWKNVVGSGYALELERKSKTSWVAKAPPGYELEPSVAESFLQMLSHLKTTKFLKGPPKPEFGLDQAKNAGVLTIEISVEGEKEPLKLTIGSPSAADKAYYATTSTLKEQVVLVPEDSFKRVLEKPVYFTKAGQ